MAQSSLFDRFFVGFFIEYLNVGTMNFLLHLLAIFEYSAVINILAVVVVKPLVYTGVFVVCYRFNNEHLIVVFCLLEGFIGWLINQRLD